MYLLSIDSSNGYSNLLITDKYFNKVSESISDFHENHSIRVFKQLDEIMQKAGLILNDLMGIAVILGPGSYTGIRVSLTIAKTLVYSLGIDIVGVESLLTCAYSFIKNTEDSKIIVAVKDAAKGNYYVSDYFADFNRQTKINLLNLSELKSFVKNMKNKPLLVYGFNDESDYQKLKNEFKDFGIETASFDLKQSTFIASMYAFECGFKNAPGYAEELSPYYVYGNGPF